MLDKCRCDKCGGEWSILGKTCEEIIHICAAEPGIMQKAANFGKALGSHAVNGFRKCTEEEIQERFKICQSNECGYFKKTGENNGVCTHTKCGCNLGNEQRFLNKLGWANQECPIKKWLKKGV
jgi:hypothetical protein